MFASQPFFSRRSKISTWPSAAAKCKAVYPSCTKRNIIIREKLYISYRVVKKERNKYSLIVLRCMKLLEDFK